MSGRGGGSRLQAPGSRELAWVLGFVLCLSLTGVRADAPLVRPLAEAEVDWAAGTITARGGAAAELRTPSAAIARPGAERRARAVAVTKLRVALEAMPGSGKLSAAQLDAALARVSTASIDYQSNGGVLLALRLAFNDVHPAPEPATAGRDGGAEPSRKVPERALSVAAMPFELAPRLTAGEREVAVAWAIYRSGVPGPGVEAMAVRRDPKGRLLLPKGEAAALQKLAGAPVVIYVQKISR